MATHRVRRKKVKLVRYRFDGDDEKPEKYYIAADLVTAASGTGLEKLEKHWNKAIETEDSDKLNDIVLSWIASGGKGKTKGEAKRYFDEFGNVNVENFQNDIFPQLTNVAQKKNWDSTSIRAARARGFLFSQLIGTDDDITRRKEYYDHPRLIELKKKNRNWVEDPNNFNIRGKTSEWMRNVRNIVASGRKIHKIDKRTREGFAKEHGMSRASTTEVNDYMRKHPQEVASYLAVQKHFKRKGYTTAKANVGIFKRLLPEADADESSFEIPEAERRLKTKEDKEVRVALAREAQLKDAQADKNPLLFAVARLIRSDPELSKLDTQQAIYKLSGKTISWDTIMRESSKEKLNTAAYEKTARKLGMEITGVKKPGRNPIKPRGRPRLFLHKTGTGAGARTYSAGGGGSKAPTRTLMGGYNMKWVGGEAKFVKQKGAAAKFSDKLKAATIGKIAPTPTQRASKFEKTFSGYYPQEKIEEGRNLMKQSRGISGWIQRRAKNREARRYSIDKNYAAKKKEQWLTEESMQAAKILKAQQEAQRRTRAATSNVYGAWYTFTKWTKWIAVTALVLAILFLPLGLFHVLGWALAVGIIALFEFIIWVFMEFWIMFAQILVSIVSLVGQAIIMVINYVGGAVSGALGQVYKPFDYMTVQNMLIFERDAAGNWVVYSYMDPTTGKQKLLTWGALNLAPPSFLKLESFMPKTFDTTTVAGLIFPPIKDFFFWIYGPIATKYTAWISAPGTEWYWPGVIIGVPLILIIIGIVLLYRYTQTKYRVM